MVVAALYSFLVDRFQAADFAGTLTINLLEVGLMFILVSNQLTNMEQALLAFLDFNRRHAAKDQSFQVAAQVAQKR